MQMTSNLLNNYNVAQVEYKVICNIRVFDKHSENYGHQLFLRVFCKLAASECVQTQQGPCITKFSLTFTQIPQ